MIVFYSGTGNSKYCAQMMADKLEEEITDSFHYIKDGISAELISGTPWIFVAPTYCWRLPHIFENFIRSARLEGCRDAYFVMTCGSDIGNAGAYIQKLCKDVGLNFKGVLPVVMPENYIAMFEVPAPELADRIVIVAQRAILKAVRAIRKGEHFKPVKVNLMGRLTSGPLNPIFYKTMVKAKPFYTTDACIGCGKCAKDCIMNNITIENGKPVWGKACTHCMACICGCPAEAIEYGRKSQNKERYICKEYVKKGH